MTDWHLVQRLLLAAVALLASTLVAALPAAAAPYRPEDPVEQPLPLVNPIGIVTHGSSGSVVVADGDQIEIHGLDGAFRHSITGFDELSAIAGDDTTVAAVDWDGVVHVIDVAGGTVAQTFTPGLSQVRHLAVADGVAWTLSPGPGSGVVTRIDLTTGDATVVAQPVSSGGDIEAIPGNPDAVLFNAGTGVVRAERQGDGSWSTFAPAGRPTAESFAVSGDGERLWTSEHAQLAIEEYDTATLARVPISRSLPTETRIGYFGDALVADGDRLARAHDGEVFTWVRGDAEIDSAARILGDVHHFDLHGDRIVAVAENPANPNGTQLVIAPLQMQLAPRTVTVAFEAYGEAPSTRSTVDWRCDPDGAGALPMRYGHSFELEIDAELTSCNFSRRIQPEPSRMLWWNEDNNTWVAGFNGSQHGAPWISVAGPGEDAGAVGMIDIYPNVFDDANVFVSQQYRDILGREPDIAGLGHWGDQLRAGTLQPAAMVQTLVDSPEYLGSIAPTTRLYLAYFRRWPDQGGLDYWLGRFRGGTSLTEISENFALSDEFERTYGSLSDREFVALVYENVLGRRPDQGGYDFWVGQMNAGLTRGGLMIEFSESVENVERTDPQIVVRSLYRGLLQREPDAGGNEFWTGYYNDTGSLVSMIDGFLASAEYANRFWVIDPIVAGLRSAEADRTGLATSPPVSITRPEFGGGFEFGP